MMTAAEKRKYVSAKLLELLAPYGYLGRNNAVWKYSLDGKYVVCISCDIARCGSLNEIEIKFGSFFAPIQKSSASAKMLFLGNLLPLAFYIRNAGLGRPLLSSYLPFEEARSMKFCPSSKVSYSRSYPKKAILVTICARPNNC